MPTLYLIPVPIHAQGDVGLSQQTIALIHTLRLFVVEHEKSARHFLRRIRHPQPFDQLHFVTLTADEDFSHQLLVDLMVQEENPRIGLLTEAGCPAVADPGAVVVRWAHAHQWQVVPLPGPSSIMLALMASGLNGQQFAFHGYLSVRPTQRRQQIKQLEQESRKNQQTKIIMEAPYRNDALLTDLVELLSPETYLCIAAALTSPKPFLSTRPVRKWKQHRPVLKKIPTLFLFLASNP